MVILLWPANASVSLSFTLRKKTRNKCLRETLSSQRYTEGAGGGPPGQGPAAVNVDQGLVSLWKKSRLRMENQWRPWGRLSLRTRGRGASRFCLVLLCVLIWRTWHWWKQMPKNHFIPHSLEGTWVKSCLLMVIMRTYVIYAYIRTYTCIHHNSEIIHGFQLEEQRLKSGWQTWWKKHPIHETHARRGNQPEFLFVKEIKQTRK